jgi:CheY-like chemotaxis protein
MGWVNEMEGKKKILVIEDEPIICRVCVKTLTASGYDVDIANNGLVGMEMADKQSYDLYFSDVRTPAMNGIQFYHYLIKKNPQLAKKIVFTTGDVMSPDVKTFLGEIKNPFLPKPFTPDELRKIVNDTIAKIT